MAVEGAGIGLQGEHSPLVGMALLAGVARPRWSPCLELAVTQEQMSAVGIHR